jgi:glutathione S-transferase
MSEIIVHGFPFSPYVRSVASTLEAKGIAYRCNHIDLRPVPGGFKSAEHEALHPFARVPILEDDGFTIYETQAILRYLDAKFPQPPLQPTEPRAIGRMNQIIGVIDWYLFPQSVRPIGAERVVRPVLMGAAPDEAVVAQALRDTAVCLSALDQLVSDGPFLVGDSISLADIMLAPQLHLIASVPEARLLLEKTRLHAWLDLMLQHPVMTATVPPPEFSLPSKLIELRAA